MNSVPNPDQITALRQEARRSLAAVQLSDGAPIATAFDLRGSKTITEDEKQFISCLQESFARLANESLSSYLRTAVELKLAAVENKSFGEFKKELPERAYLAGARLSSPDSQVLFHVDLPLVFQIVDLMLGGDGKDQTPDRDLTDIEEEIFESAGRVLCDELRSAWKPVLETEIRLEKRQRVGHLESLIPATERLLLTTFDVTLGENQSKLSLVLPVAASTALLRNAKTQTPDAKPKNSQKNRARLQELAANCLFDTELILPVSPVSVRELYALQPGSMVVLSVRATEPIHFNVGGKNMFLAAPVGCGSQRGAQIERPLSIAQPKGNQVESF